MNKIKGFTLIELLAVIAILAVIVTIAFPIVANLIESSREKTFDLQEEYMSKATKDFIILNPEYAPQNIGESTNITLQTLVDEGAIDLIKDPKDKTTCNSSSSYITVTMIADNEYTFEPCLVCANYASSITKSECITANRIWYNNTCNNPRSSGGMVQDDNNYYVIETTDDFLAIASNLNYNYILGTNLSFSEISNYTPIGADATPFTGIFEGQEFIMSDFIINHPATTAVAIFGVVDSGEINNLSIENVTSTGNDNVGGLVGTFRNGSVLDNANITNSTITGNASNIGGLVGNLDASIIINSSSGATVYGTNYGAGGLAGWVHASSEITNSYATGYVESINGNGALTGGLVGTLSTTSNVDNCYATGNVYTLNKGGGLVGGILSGANIKNSYATGDVDGNTKIGGFIGSVDTATIRNCYATGDLTVVATSSIWEFGGFAGVMVDGDLYNVYSLGNIGGNSADSVGGLVGAASNSSTITNTYNISNISGAHYYVGGIIGQSYVGTNTYITNSYQLGDVLGSSYVGDLYTAGTYTNSNLYTYYEKSANPSGVYIYSTKTYLADQQNTSWFTNTLLFDSNWLIDANNTIPDTHGNIVIKPLLYKIDENNNPTATLVGGQ